MVSPSPRAARASRRTSREPGSPAFLLPPAAANFCAQTPVKPEVPPHIMRENKARLEQLLSIRRLVDDHPVQVLPFLFLGSYKHAKNAQLMRKLAITHICNVAAGDCQPSSDMDPAINYCGIDAEDSKSYQLLEMNWEEVYRFVESCRLTNGRVLLHCRAGVNRSATLAIAYMMTLGQCPLLQVVREVFEKRPSILTNTGFQEQLVTFAHEHNLLRARSGGT